MAKGFRRCVVPSYESHRLKEMVWKLRDVDSVPYKFNREPIHGPDDFAQMYAFLFHEEPTEKMVVFVMNTRQLCVAVDTICKGSIDSAPVHPREVFRSAIGCGGSSIMLAHNHPSGGTEPSHEDLSVTRQLVEAGKILGIRVTDHIIFGSQGRYTSFVERNLI